MTMTKLYYTDARIASLMAEWYGVKYKVYDVTDHGYKERR